MQIRIKRVYDPVDPSDGLRILVDRLWPRGLSKSAARIDHWVKEVAPSTPLRQWYGHEPAKWDEFRRRYFAELDENREVVEALRVRLVGERVTFLFGSKEERLNNAAALVEYIHRDRRG